MEDTKKIVAIQGYSGAFHEIAARGFFQNNNLEIFPCSTFEESVEACENYQADFTVMAIENTVSGSILQNYALLRNSNLLIIGEIYLRIAQSLLVNDSISIQDLKEVHSHPMAINQCRVFFKKYPHIKLVESEDTALSAKYVADNKLKDTGAIASKLAADIYKLNIIADGIETNKRNYTRFLVLIQRDNIKLIPSEIDKSSLCFTVPHETGSLSKVLSVIAFYGINLTKIQSFPILGREWQYLIFIDITFNDAERYRKALEAIKPLTDGLEIMGEYQIGKKSFKEVHNYI